MKGGNEQQTRHIMCCEVDDSAEDSAVDRNPNLPNSGGSDHQQQQQQQQQESAYYSTEQTNVNPNVVAEEYLAAQEWMPTWYTRSDGWLGQTYEQALDFCQSLGDTSDLCQYSVICPTGPNHLPYGGKVVEAGGSWAPIKDSKNGWVQVGDENVCIRYMTLHLETPSWGITGEANEDITRHLPCCTAPFLPTYNPTTTETNFDEDVTASFAVPTSSNTLPSGNGEMNNYELAAMEYEPVFYDRSTGWTGQTWNEAITFCASRKNNFNEQMALCPFDALCPMGPGSMPFQGEKFDFFQTWVPINGAQENEWIQVGSDPDTQCITHSQVVGHQADWGVTGVGNEGITRHVMCCAINGGRHDFSQVEQPATVVNVADAVAKVESKYKPVEYDRQSGWEGSTYVDAIVFCASQDSRIPCPFEAYCPNGEYAGPYGGVSDNPNGAWAPMINAPNSWVQIGNVATCQKYNDIHSHPPSWGLTGENSESFTQSLLCCEEPYEHESSLVKPFSPLSDKEETVVNDLHPVWFSRSHGYRGTNHEEAELFCNTVVGLHLCPIEAYCPNGPTDQKPLYLQKDAFQGEQWAPVSPSAGTQTDLGNKYVMIGTLGDNPYSTCTTYDSLHANPLPPWSADGSKTELKQHVMCCEGAETKQQQHAIEAQMSPIWLDTKHGWGGGSHQDAQKFCNELGGKKLCPYSAYCPHGVGRQPLGGHSTDFNSQGVQYAPLFGESNEWVMIGQKDGNAATTCMLHTQLEGGEPDWGLNEERQDIKNHILCCGV